MDSISGFYVIRGVLSVGGTRLAPTETECRVAEMHRRICHALYDVHLAARMPRAFLNFLSEYDERILLTFNATEHKIKAS